MQGVPRKTQEKKKPQRKRERERVQETLSKKFLAGVGWISCLVKYLS